MRNMEERPEQNESTNKVMLIFSQSPPEVLGFPSQTVHLSTKPVILPKTK